MDRVKFFDDPICSTQLYKQDGLCYTEEWNKDLLTSHL